MGSSEVRDSLEASREKIHMTARHLVFLLAMVVVVSACSGNKDSDFERKLKKIKIGMTPPQVKTILGLPKLTYHAADEYSGNWPSGTLWIAEYGCIYTNQNFRCSGTVFFNTNKVVSHVYGRSGRIRP